MNDVLFLFFHSCIYFLSFHFTLFYRKFELFRIDYLFLYSGIIPQYLIKKSFKKIFFIFLINHLKYTSAVNHEFYGIEKLHERCFYFSAHMHKSEYNYEHNATIGKK